MIHKTVQRTGWFIGLVLLQAIVLNRIYLFGYATPFLYIYFLIRFDVHVSRNRLMLWAFFLGLAVDVFSNTPGVNAAASVLFAFARPMLLNLFISPDPDEMPTLALHSLGIPKYLLYIVFGVLLHHMALFALLYFS
ncbi:MAG: rod shape-determining protein MreD, partial [Prevotellaceae bacterium]|nr:rod shape-determining protein MreD [Prevotellaceae bacterium]